MLETAHGDVEIGPREGSAAWIDAQTGYGSVRSQLDPAAAPHKSADSVEVRART